MSWRWFCEQRSVNGWSVETRFILSTDHYSCYLISRDARRRLVAAHLVNLHAFVADARIQVFADVAREVFSRRIQFLVKRRQLVQVSMVEIADNFVRRFFQIAEIDQQTDVVQLRAARV